MNKRALAVQRRARVAERSGIPPGPMLVDRDEHGKAIACTPSGLKLIERLARDGAPQSKIAASLGLPQRRLKTMLDRNEGENPTRLAYERGHADFEHEIVKRLLKHGTTNPIPLIFLAKAKLGWREGDQPAALAQSNISLVLLRPMSTEEYFKTLGITAPLDFSRPRPQVGAPSEEPALPAPKRSPRDFAPVVLHKLEPEENETCETKNLTR